MNVILYDLSGAAGERFSPYCWRAKMALAHKGLSIDSKPTPFTDIAALAGGQYKTVPIIEDQGHVVGDSFHIAEHLEQAYPDRPSLFGGPGGQASARFVENWAFAALHGQIAGLVAKDICDLLTPPDQVYFRTSRELRFGKTLEEAQAGREQRLGDFHKALEPLRRMLAFQSFIGGHGPLFADYIVFGTLQWPRIVAKIDVLPPAGDPVRQWFERCLDLYGGLGRRAA